LKLDVERYFDYSPILHFFVSKKLTVEEDILIYIFLANCNPSRIALLKLKK